MLEELLAKPENKTIEFKENAQPIQKIVQTVIAFANTAGGTLIIGVKGETKEVVGVTNILEDEERVANAVADSVSPSILPNLQFHSWRGRDILIVTVPHSFAPFYLKAKGERDGVYVRLGSTNRIADASLIAEIKRLKEHTSFDQSPEMRSIPDELDFDLARQLFSSLNKPFTKSTAKSLELLVNYQEKLYPTKGAVLLFGKNRNQLFPDPLIRLARFKGITKYEVIDQAEIKSPLSIAIDEILAFIQRNTSLGAKIHSIRREDIPEYPPVAVRETVINAILHTDYSTQRSPIQIAIFDNRLEVTNPGPLPFGLSLETALSGVSQLRNKVLGRVFRELQLIEQWGSGLNRISSVCKQQKIAAPKFEELDHFFRVTLYPRTTKVIPSQLWHVAIIEHIKQHGKISAMEAEKIWKLSRRTTTSRLKKMCQEGILVELSTGPFDPYKMFILSEPRNQPRKT
ncbi:MAG: ATP-binding protein [Candidatus Rhabdochlamydia sp.]